MKNASIDLDELKQKIDDFVEKKENFGDAKIKITKDILNAVKYIRSLGGTWEDVQDCIEEIIGIKLSISGLRKAYTDYKKEKISSEKNRSQLKQSSEKTLEDKPANSEKKEKFNNFDNQVQVDNYNDVLVLDGIKYRKKQKCYDSGNAEIEAKLDEYELKMDNGAAPSVVKGKYWNYYVCRYSEDPKYIEIGLKDAAIKDIPKEYLKRWEEDFFTKIKKYHHLEQVS